jgi:hypothetical protein
MPAKFHGVQNANLVVLAAVALSALTVSASAQVHHPITRVFARDHTGQVGKPPSPAGTYDPASATVRDHRSNAGSGAASMPAGHSPK